MNDRVKRHVTRRPYRGRDLCHQIFATADGSSIRLRTVLIAALGMGVPVVMSLFLRRPEAGFTIGLGAILLSGATPATGAPSSAGEGPWMAILPAVLSVAAATLIAGRPWTDAAMIGLATVAAMVSGYSRTLAVGAIRFGIYFVLCVGFLDGTASERHDAAFVFGLGALWNIVLRKLLMNPLSATDTPTEAARIPKSAQRRAHFRKTLRSLAGWQFPARLGWGLVVASMIRHFWPAHHFYWIMLTVALLTQRPIEHLPAKTIQRLLGTIVGVGIAWAIVTNMTSPPILSVFACIFATLVPIARARSYLLYSIVATPLILLVLDLGRPIDIALLSDRIIATMIGGGLVIAGNAVANRLLHQGA